MGNGKNMRIIDLIMKVPVLNFKPLFSRLMKVKRAYLAAVLVLVAVPAVFLCYGFVHMIGTQ